MGRRTRTPAAALALMAAVACGVVATSPESSARRLLRTPRRYRSSCENDDVVGRIDPATDRMVGTVEVGLSPRFALSAFGSLWVSNFVEGSVSPIDPLAGKVVATIDVESGPQLMVATRTGSGSRTPTPPPCNGSINGRTRSSRRSGTRGPRPTGWSSSTEPYGSRQIPGPSSIGSIRRTRRSTDRGRSRTRGRSAPTSCSRGRRRVLDPALQPG